MPFKKIKIHAYPPNKIMFYSKLIKKKVLTQLQIDLDFRLNLIYGKMNFKKKKNNLILLKKISPETINFMELKFFPKKALRMVLYLIHIDHKPKNLL